MTEGVERTFGSASGLADPSTLRDRPKLLGRARAALDRVAQVHVHLRLYLHLLLGCIGQQWQKLSGDSRRRRPSTGNRKVKQKNAWSHMVIDALESPDSPAISRMHQELQAARDTTEQEAASVREDAREDFRREFNITRSESVDVTELYYREQGAQSEVERLRSQVDKLDAEIRRMREHIEQEPKRISSAVEAAKTPVQNYIEQGGKR